jgi:hypothetical protein
MGLSRLDNFLKNSRGDILYVDPSNIDSTDTVENQGNSLARPFKTIQRALIEAARFSYQRGLDNDRFGRTTIIVYPGEHLIDNRPGWIPIHDAPITGNNWIQRGGATANNFSAFSLNTNFDLTSDDNDLYKMNSVYGGVIIPRGTSIVGMDLRKTKVRAKFVPNPEDDTIDTTSIFRVTGSCYFYQFTFFDSDPNGTIFKDYGTEKFVPNFSHHKLTCFEYADGTNPVKINDGYLQYSSTKTDLDIYYQKIGLSYGPSSGRDISPDLPSSGIDIQPKIDEFRIVGSKGQDVGITSIRSGDGLVSSTTITVNIAEPIDGLDVDTPIRIAGVPSAGYNGQFVINSVLSSTQIRYKVSTPPANALPTISSGTPTLSIVVDTVTSASPYIFNCSLRSVFGMCGLHADGNKASGFKSMVVAQFTGIGLQKDDNAFVKYNPTSGVYDDNTSISNIHTNTSARYKPSYENFHIKASNDAFLQLVSVFAIGYANHFLVESGGDHSITNSNSNFGAKSLVARGFKKEAFSRDDTGFITHIIPPQEIEPDEVTVEYYSIDVKTTVGVGSTSRLYLYNETNQNIKPNSVIEGYRIGAKIDDTLNVLLNRNGTQTVASSIIVMPNTQNSGIYESTSKKFVTVGRDSIGINSISANTFSLTSQHKLLTGESIRIFSSDGELPDGLNHNQVYYAITSGISTNQLKVAQTYNDAIAQNEVNINNKGGTLTVESRISDKVSGDIGHPIQYDTGYGQWYITVSGDLTKNDLYSNIVGLGTSVLGNATPRTFIKRTQDTRSLNDKIYKLRYVIPKDSVVVSRPPQEGFVLQESNNTIGDTTEEILKYNSVDTVSLVNSSELRNYKFISGAIWDSVTGVTTITTETPNELSVGSLVEINNIKSSNNTTGVGNTGFNGAFVVTSKPTRRSFTIGISTNPGSFTSDTSSRGLNLPYYNRRKLNNTFVVYKSEQIQEYIEDTKDGIYHLTILDTSNSPSVAPFAGLRFSQPVKNLYPQLDRDNLNFDPNPTKSFALPDPIGLVQVNNIENSITRESLNKNFEDFSVGIAISDIQSQSGIAHTIFTRIDHGLNRITKVGIVSTGLNYGDGSGSSRTLYNARLVGFGGSTTGQYATANIKIDSNGSITAVKIIDGGSSYGIGNTLSVVGVATTAGHVYGIISVTNIYNNVGDSIRIDGVSGNLLKSYNNLYRITSINVGQSKQIQVSSSSTVTVDYDYGPSAAIAGVNTNGLSKFASEEISNVNLYVTGETVGISSFTYNNVTGISSIITSKPHGYNLNSKVKLGGFDSDLYNGEFIIQRVEGLDAFYINVGVTTQILPSTGTPYVYRPSYSSQGGVITSDNERSSSRLIPQYLGITTNISVALTDPSINVLTFTNTSVMNWNLGDYLIINNEIMRVSQTVTSSTAINVFRGLFGSSKESHPVNSVVKRVRFTPIEFRRNSIIRASGHTFEYLGIGPGNYSTALPERQDRKFGDIERVLSQSVSDDGGTPIYNGLDDNGNAYTVNKVTKSSTGQDLLIKSPIPTVRGEDITSNTDAVGFDIQSTDALTVSGGLLIEGGSDSNIISKFDGPVIFSRKVSSNSNQGIEATSLSLKGDASVARKYTVGISTPSLSGNAGDVVYKTDPPSGSSVGWVYTADNYWREYGPIKSHDQKYVGIFSGSFTGDGAGLFNVSDIWTDDGVGISTTKNVGFGTISAKPDVALYANGSARFDGVAEFNTASMIWNVPNGFLVNTGITTFYQQLNANTFRTVGVSTFQNTLIVTTNPATTGNTVGNYVKFVQTDTSITSAYKYGGLQWEGSDTGNNGIRGFIRGEAEGTTGQFAIVFGTQGSGISNPQEQLRIGSDGNITASGEITANSDAKLKTNIKTIENALDKVLQLRGVEYDRVDRDGHQIGVIAQEIQKILPEVVYGDDTKSVAYGNITAVLIEAIKEQQKQIDAQSKQIEELIKRLDG